MDWRETVGHKLVSPQEAVAVVKPGDQVMVPPFPGTPYTLCGALYERRGELSNVRIDHPASLFAWVRPGEESRLEVHTPYATPLDRAAVNAGQVEYLPTARWRGIGRASCRERG